METLLGQTKKGKRELSFHEKSASLCQIPNDLRLAAS